MSETISNILCEPEPQQQCDLLGQALAKLRQGTGAAITAGEAQRLHQAYLEEINRPKVNVRLCDRIWALLPYCPACDSWKRLATVVLDNPRVDYRGYAMAYLLSAYPVEAASLIARFDGDADPYVQDAMARFEYERDPLAAVQRWEGAIARCRLTHELSETLPFNIAYALPGDQLGPALQRYDELGKTSPGNLWARTAAAIRQRLAGAQR
jgi:hypothetical protein